MSSSVFNRYKVIASVATALLAGCGELQLPISAPGAMAQSRAMSYRLLHSFGGMSDGVQPVASLLDVNGTLYGTTKEGGTYGDGTVFSINTPGTEHVLYSFDGRPDGQNPLASLIDVNGTLYGTTEYGGANGVGAVYSITASGTERVLHSFAVESNGAWPTFAPFASLVNVKGTLYGTTARGGTYNSGSGTVFSVSTAGTEHMLHSFGKGSDGIAPEASLTDAKGTLYSTTFTGGAYCVGYGSSGCGTVFSITITGAEKVLHNFSGAPDGIAPVASLIDVKGMLYGTTGIGGPHYDGTVYSITTTGTEHVLYSFSGGADGAFPTASLIDVKGTLYGTTIVGGAYNDGTVFSVTPSGVEHVLHSFGSGSDGVNPRASLIDVHGTLYGTTEKGGTYGDGTVFALSP